MSKRPRERLSKKFSGNHQRSWLWGFHAATETLASGRWPVLEILVTEATYARAQALLLEETTAGIPLQVVPASRIEELIRVKDHQGILVRLGPFPYGDWQTLESELHSLSRVELPLLVLCDRLQDSFNMGAILRSSAAANVQAVVVGDRHQAEINSHVARSSAGAINYLPIIRVQDLVLAAQRLKELGLALIAADSNATAPMWDADLKHPAVLIIGSEAQGVDPRLLDVCDHRIQIPMNPRVNSLNAAVASGILMYEIRRQQRGVIDDF